MDKRSFDAIVIGSGMGGLTTASLLAQAAKMRVLVLERHFKLGGFTHSFRRKQFEWDTGIHYVGQMQSGTLTRRVMDYVTGGSVEWNPMSEVVERLLFPDTSFEIPRGSGNLHAKLVERFPDERAAIDRYFRDVRKAQLWMNRWFIAKTLPKYAADLWLRFGKARAMQITAERLLAVKSDELRAILTAQWPDYGTPPEQSAFAVHATVAADYFDGGFFPVGGGRTIAECVKTIVTQRGGECRTGHEAVRILTKQNRVTGVRVRHKGDEFEVRAPVVISNVGARNTFAKLLDDNVVAAERSKLDQIAQGVSAVVLFLGLNSDPRDHGFDDANYWIYSSLDVGRESDSTETERFPLNAAFVSFGSLRDPQKKTHTAQIITFCNSDSWKAFEDSQWMRAVATMKLARNASPSLCWSLPNDPCPDCETWLNITSWQRR
ncbi:MAG: NAD(P)/FAD-dependent oxidoreductase [Pirellulales bacterium]